VAAVLHKNWMWERSLIATMAQTDNLLWSDDQSASETPPTIGFLCKAGGGEE
jgi:hypothetical protein